MNIALNDEKYFITLNGLWKGVKPPFKNVGVIRNTNFTKNGIIDLSDVAYLDVEIKKFENRKLLYGDIIIERSGGGPSQPVGRVVYFDIKDGDYSFSNFTSVIRVTDKDVILPKFLFYFMLDFYFSGATNYLQERTTGIRNLNFNKYLETVCLPLIDITEQKMISKILSKIQESIFLEEKNILLSVELKNTLMNKIFKEGLNKEIQKETEIGLMPMSWEPKRIDEVFEYTNKPRSLNLDSYDEIPFIPMDMIADDKIKVEIYEQRKRRDISSGTYFENGDLLVAKITPSFENGKQAIVEIDKNFGYATTEVIPIKDKAGISDKLYLFYYLLKPEIRAVLAGKMEGSTGRQRLSKAVLSEQMIPFPKYNEQKQIAEIFSKIDDKISNSKNKIKHLNGLFYSTLHELMSGNIKLNNKNFEQEEAHG